MRERQPEAAGYRVEGLPDGVRSAVGAKSLPVTNAYDIAKAGGPGSKYLKQLDRQGPNQLRKSMASLEIQAVIHQRKLSAPQDHVPDWHGRSDQYRAGLLTKWASEVRNFRLEAEVIQGYIDEQGI